MNETEQIDGDALAVATVTIMLTQTFHAVLSGALQVGETAVWIAELISGPVTLACHWPVARQITLRRNGNLLDVATDAGAAGGSAPYLCPLPARCGPVDRYGSNWPGHRFHMAVAAGRGCSVAPTKEGGP